MIANFKINSPEKLLLKSKNKAGQREFNARVHELVVGLEADALGPVRNLLGERRLGAQACQDLLLELLVDARDAEEVCWPRLLHCERQSALNTQ